MCPVICFFAVEAILSVWGDLESFEKKMWPVTQFVRSADYLKFWMGLRKVSTIMCAQLHDVFLFFFFAVETNLSFWWDLEKFSEKSVPSHLFLRCGDYLKFLMGLGKFRQKDVTSYTFFFAVETIWNFWWDLKSFDKKVWPVSRFFAVETILSVWGDLESFEKKMWPVTQFVRSADYLKFWMGLRKVSTIMCAQLHDVFLFFFRCGD